MWKSEGFHLIDNEVDATEMTKHIPPRTRIMRLFITGGGPRKVKEAELEDKEPKPQECHNPLNILLPSELAKLNKKVLVDDVAGNNDETDNDDVEDNDRERINDVEGYAADDDVVVEEESVDPKFKRAAKGKAKLLV